ncbi:MAG: glycosyltransferase family 39 protein [Anaerolineae bacterium]|nr:glycosyltransferase family 39 protein [Anaerolineae bacterium]
MRNIPHFRNYRAFYFVLIIFLMALGPRITTLSGTFIVNDETLYWSWTNEFVTALLNFDWAGTLVGKGYPSVTVFWVHGAGFLVHFLVDTLRGYSWAEFVQRAALDQPFNFDLLGQRRLAMGLANALLLGLIFWQARLLVGEAIAFLGTGLMALSPFLLADARTMRGDALMSSLMLASVLGFLLFLLKRRWFYLVFSGLSLGLAMLTKITAIPVTGFVVLAMGLYLGLYRREVNWLRRLRWGVVVLLDWGGIVALTIVALWPALWVAPGEVFVFVRNYALGSIDGRLNYFWGQLTFDQSIPLFYPNAFLFRATPLVVLGGAIMAGLAGISGWHLLRWMAGWKVNLRYRLDNLWRMTVPARWTLLALGVYSVVYWLVLNAGALKRDRYLMPIFPAVHLIAAAGLLWLVKQVGQRWPGANWPIWGVFGLLLALQWAQVLSTHPFYYTYWSPLLGGGRVAQQAMMAESGVETLALVELSQSPDAKNQTLALLYTRDFAPAYTGRVVRLADQSPWITAGHVLLRQYHFQTEKLDPNLLEYLYRKRPERVIEFQGYAWAWLYPGPAAQYYAGSLLDGQAELLGYNLSRDRASVDRPLQVKLFWRNRGYNPRHQIFVRLVDAQGFAWAAMTAQPLPQFEAVAGKLGAIVESEAFLQIPPGTPPGLYFLKIGLTVGPDEPDIGEFALPSAGDKVVVERPAVQPTLVFTYPLSQKLTHNLTLLGTDVEPPLILTPQTPQPLTLYWQAGENITADYGLLFRLVDAAGNEVASWSGRPARGLYPTSRWQPGELVRDPWLLNLAEAQQTRPVSPGYYHLQLVLFAEPSGPATGEVLLGRVEVLDRRRLYTLPPVEHPLEVRLGEAIFLLGYDLTQVPLTGGARSTLTLYWQAVQPVSLDYTVFAQMLDPTGQVVGQHDGLPAAGTLPTTAWEVGEIIPDRHQFDFALTQSGLYRLIVGMYNPQTGKRLPVTDPQGQAAGDFWTLYTFEAGAAK